MNKVNSLKLYKDFEWLYRMRHKEEEPIPIYGFQCEDGWFDLIYNLSKELTEHGNKKGRIAEVTQVKEKFGTLSFYVRSADDEERKIIEKYTKLSGQTCELCGRPGKLGALKDFEKTWYMVRCEEHEWITPEIWSERGSK